MILMDMSKAEYLGVISILQKDNKLIFGKPPWRIWEQEETRNKRYEKYWLDYKQNHMLGSWKKGLGKI